MKGWPELIRFLQSGTCHRATITSEQQVPLTLRQTCIELIFNWLPQHTCRSTCSWTQDIPTLKILSAYFHQRSCLLHIIVQRFFPTKFNTSTKAFHFVLFHSVLVLLRLKVEKLHFSKLLLSHCDILPMVAGLSTWKRCIHLNVISVTSSGHWFHDF